jgi:hypothetical protein
MKSNIEDSVGTQVNLSSRINNNPAQEVIENITKLPRKPRFRVVPVNTERVSKRKPYVIEIKLDESLISFIEHPQTDQRRSERQTFTIMPFLKDIDPTLIPSENNPRSHPTDCVRSRLSKEILETLREQPENFVSINRGGCIIAAGFDYDTVNKVARIHISDPEIHGLCDGATSATTIAKFQHEILGGRKLSEIPEDEMPEELKVSQWKIEIITGIHDRDFIADIVAGRNTSLQVKEFSLADFRGEFEWLKGIFDAEDSTIRGMVGWDENCPQRISGLDALALLNGFRRFYDERPEIKEGENESEDEIPTPIVSYSGKSKLVELLSKNESAKSFQELGPIALDIVSLYEHIYKTFADKYENAFKHTKLGKRIGITSKKNKEQKFHTPYFHQEVDYSISNGFLYPLLFGFRSLVSYGASGRAKAHWKVEDPKAFWDKHAEKLIRTLIQQVSSEKSNVNRAAKKPAIYIALHQQVENIYLKDKNPEAEAA